MAQSWYEISPGRVPTPMRPRGPIDLVHLAKQTLGDSGLEYEILRMFDQMAMTYFGRVRDSATLADLAMNLHSLKGAASGIGAWNVADMAKTAEDELRTSGALNAERIDDLHISVQEVSAYIGELLKNEPA